MPAEGLTVSGISLWGWDRKAEDSLENTFSCVPKVQGVMPNLSGKWTETQIKRPVMGPCCDAQAVLYGLLFCLGLN